MAAICVRFRTDRIHPLDDPTPSTRQPLLDAQRYRTAPPLLEFGLSGLRDIARDAAGVRQSSEGASDSR
jgi:hypothetical protein